MSSPQQTGTSADNIPHEKKVEGGQKGGKVGGPTGGHVSGSQQAEKLGASLADRIPREKALEGAHKGGEVQHQKAMERRGETDETS